MKLVTIFFRVVAKLLVLCHNVTKARQSGDFEGAGQGQR
jgi:hypothetical protein